MKNILKKGFNLIFLICFVYILYNAIFNNGVNLFNWNKYIIALGVIFNIAILILSYKYVNRKTKINTKILIPICFIVIFIIQCIVGNLFKVLPNWDIKYLVQGAYSYINGETDYLSYLYRYSNNIAIQILFIVLLKISNLIKIIDYYNIAILFNIVIIDITLLFTYLVAKKIFDTKKAFIIFLSIASMTPIYLYVPIIYTDTLSMLFPILILYLYVTAKEKTNKKMQYYGLMAIAISVGISLKITVIIMPIAIVIYEILNRNKKEILFISITIIIAFLITLLIRNIIIKNVFTSWNEKDYNNEKFPITHWIMMGLSDAGKYNEEDVEYTKSFTTLEEKKENNKKEINKRIKNITLNSIRRKLMYTWGDGTYFAVNTLDYDAINEGFHQKLIFKRGEYHQYYQYYTQIQHITIITLIIIVTIFQKQEIDYIFILRLSIFGLFIFLLIWETRSRYLIHYLPIMQIIAFAGIEKIYININKKLHH